MNRTCRTLAALVLTALPAAGAPTSPEWPQFRGPCGDGHAPADADPPLRWSETEHVAWKTPVPHQGWSSPVVCEGRIWLTTATTDGREMFVVCVDAASGKVLRNERLFHNENPEPLGNRVNCYASPTPVAEPGRVYIHFGSYGTACLDAETGKPVWQRRDLPCRHYRGPGSSPIRFGDLLILSMDGVDVQYLVALDAKTGKTVWKTNRSVVWKDLDKNGKPFREGDLRKAYSTPLVVDAGGKPTMFTLGAKAVYAYEPTTGRELWRVEHPGYSGASRPVFDGSRVIFTSGFGKSELLALRADGKPVWTMQKGVPQKPSPLLVDDLLYLINDGGIATCAEAATGEVVWQERVGER